MAEFTHPDHEDVLDWPISLHGGVEKPFRYLTGDDLREAADVSYATGQKQLGSSLVTLSQHLTATADADVVEDLGKAEFDSAFWGGEAA